jgi:hypothetical protein
MRGAASAQRDPVILSSPTRSCDMTREGRGNAIAGPPRGRTNGSVVLPSMRWRGSA